MCSVCASSRNVAHVQNSATHPARKVAGGAGALTCCGNSGADWPVSADCFCGTRGSVALRFCMRPVSGWVHGAICNCCWRNFGGILDGRISGCGDTSLSWSNFTPSFDCNEGGQHKAPGRAWNPVVALHRGACDPLSMAIQCISAWRLSRFSSRFVHFVLVVSALMVAQATQAAPARSLDGAWETLADRPAAAPPGARAWVSPQRGKWAHLNP